MSDLYHELGDLFGVQLSPHNRWAGAKWLRERWQAHIDAALVRPVRVADEAQDMSAVVLNEIQSVARGQRVRSRHDKILRSDRLAWYDSPRRSG